MNTARQEAILVAREKISSRPVYLDTETTGIERNDEIIEICLVDDDGQVVFESLVRPTRSIPSSATRIHGITNEMIRSAQTWPLVWPKIQPLMQGHLIGIYNADFDLRLLQQTHARFNMRWLQDPGFTGFCIMKLYAQYVGEWNTARGTYRWHSLEDAGRQCRIPLQNTHHAKDDSLLARALLHYIAETQS